MNHMPEQRNNKELHASVYSNGNKSPYGRAERLESCNTTIINNIPVQYLLLKPYCLPSDIKGTTSKLMFPI